MTREKCENAIASKMKEVVELYHQYNPDGKYLDLSFVNGSISGNNEYWKDDCKKPIIFFYPVDEDCVFHNPLGGEEE